MARFYENLDGILGGGTTSSYLSAIPESTEDSPPERDPRDREHTPSDEAPSTWKALPPPPPPSAPPPIQFCVHATTDAGDEDVALTDTTDSTTAILEERQWGARVNDAYDKTGEVRLIRTDSNPLGVELVAFYSVQSYGAINLFNKISSIW